MLKSQPLSHSMFARGRVLYKFKSSLTIRSEVSTLGQFGGDARATAIHRHCERILSLERGEPTKQLWAGEENFVNFFGFQRLIDFDATFLPWQLRWLPRYR